jgi:hypothetical protein
MTIGINHEKQEETMAEINKKNLKAVTRLIEAGITDEKEIVSLGISRLLEIPNITIQELSAISELQKAVKAGKVISFLAGGVTDEA